MKLFLISSSLKSEIKIIRIQLNFYSISIIFTFDMKENNSYNKKDQNNVEPHGVCRALWVVFRSAASSGP